MKNGLMLLLLMTSAGLSLSAKNSFERADKNIGITKLNSKVYLLQSSFACNGHLDCNHLLILDRKDMVLINTPSNDSLTAIMLNCIGKKCGHLRADGYITFGHNFGKGSIIYLKLL